MLPPLDEMSQAVEQLLSQEVLVSQEECQAVVEGIVLRSLHCALQTCCTSDAQC